MSRFPDHYAVLGIPSDASQREIRAAYVRLLKRHFGAGEDAMSLPAERISLMQAAYTCLRDPVRRAEHDDERALRSRDHVAAIRRRRHRLLSHDRRRGAPAPHRAHWQPAAALAGLGGAVLGLIAWLYL